MHDELRRVPKTSLSIVSAYFTINAYNALKESLDKIDGLRFLFGEPKNNHYAHTSQISHIKLLGQTARYIYGNHLQRPTWIY